jgi:membrane peptidoglycan carboxypeptidase
MADTTFAMQAVVERGSGAAAKAVGRPLAGKTGTTSDNKAAWFDGFAPQLATAVGIYRPGPNGEELEMKDIAGLREITGSSLPVKIWTQYMRAAMEGVEVQQFPAPAYMNKDVAPRAPTQAPQPTRTETPTEAPSETPSAPPTQAPTPTPSNTPRPSATIPTPPVTPTPPVSPSIPPTAGAPRN